MARANQRLIDKLREAAAEIEGGARYSWGHVGHCNCGQLARRLTPFEPAEIQRRAAAGVLDEWTEYANDYCPAEGTPMDAVMDAMFDAGLDLNDIHHLEYLSDRAVLDALPGGFRHLRKGDRRDAALYMRTWAALLELELKRRCRDSALLRPVR